MKWVLIGIGVLLLLAVALLLAVPYLVNTSGVQAAIAQAASQALGRPVSFASLSLAALPLPALRLTDLRVAEDPKFGTTPFLTVGEGRLGLRLWPLLRGRVEVTELTLERPRLSLIQESGGRWNIASFGARAGGASPAVKSDSAPPGRGLLPPISRIRVVDGSLSYQALSRKPGDAGRGSPIAYRLGGLRFTASGTGFGAPIHFDGETRVTPGDLRVKVEKGSLIPAAGRPLAESALKADVEVQSEDIAAFVRALPGPFPELAGPLRGKLALSGTVAKLAARGELEFPKLRLTKRQPHCPEPKTRSLTLEAVRFALTYTPLSLTSRPLSAGLGGGTATVALSLDFAPHPVLRLSEISIKALPLAPVLRDYLCHGYAVSAPLDLSGDLAARPGDPWRTLAGQGQVRIGTGRVVGPEGLALLGGVARLGGALTAALNVDLPPALFASPLVFDSITASYRIADGRLITRDFLYSSARLKVTAAGEYGLADGRMNLDLVLTSGRSEIRALVTGSAASPSIRIRTPAKVLEAGPERLRRLFRGLTGQSP